MRRFEFELLADHFQFYLQDESIEGDLGESWSEEAVARLLAVAPGTVGVGTVRNMEVPVVVEVLTAAPDSDADSWDHVTECSLEVLSGRIVVSGCSDYFPDAARVEVTPGTYRIRASYGLLDTVSQDGLDGEDRYRVQLWRGETTPPRVIKDRAHGSNREGPHPVRDEDNEYPVAAAWRPAFHAIVDAFVRGDFRLASGVAGVAPVSLDTAEHIRSYIADYGDTLAQLSSQTWETSRAQWMGTHWDVVVDLWTQAAGRSDMVLSARVSESGGEYQISVGIVYVP